VNKLLLLVIAAGLGYAAHTNPDFSTHQNTISESLQDQQYYTEEQNAERFGDLDFTNFLVASVTKDTVKMSMVSYGFLGRVSIVDEDWRPRPIQ